MSAAVHFLSGVLILVAMAGALLGMGVLILLLINDLWAARGRDERG